MGKRILVIQGHPDPRPERLCRGLADAYHRSALAAGYEVRVVDVTRIEFTSLRSRNEWEGPIPAILRELQEAIRWAEHLIIYFPIWLGTMPALLKGLLRAGAAPGIRDGSLRPRPLAEAADRPDTDARERWIAKLAELGRNGT